MRNRENSAVGEDDQARSKVEFEVEVGFEPCYQRLETSLGELFEKTHVA